MTFTAGRGARALLCTLTVLLTGGITALLRLLWLPFGGWLLIPPLIATGVCVGYLPRLVRSLYGAIGDEAVYVRYGVLWKRETVVPFNALRTYELWTPPLHTVFRCRTVVLRFAGGCVWLPLLDEHVAARLTQRLEEI